MIEIENEEYIHIYGIQRLLVASVATTDNSHLICDEKSGKGWSSYPMGTVTPTYRM